MGVVLHYIQDAYTSVISYNSPSNQLWHHNYEQSIEDAPFVNDIQGNLQYYFRDDYPQLKKYSTIAGTLLSKVEGKNATMQIATLVGQYPSEQTGKPIVDRNLALEACFVVSQSVLSSKTNPQIDLGT